MPRGQAWCGRPDMSQKDSWRSDGSLGHDDVAVRPIFARRHDREGRAGALIEGMALEDLEYNSAVGHAVDDSLEILHRRWHRVRVSNDLHDRNRLLDESIERHQ